MAKADAKTLGLTMMYALHAAFRRDLQLLARNASRQMSEPASRHPGPLGAFKEQIEHHHQGEDHGLWPRMRQNLPDRQDGLDVLVDMEAEHAIIDPAVETVDQAFRTGTYERVADALDDLTTKTVSHFAHEQRDVVPLASETLQPAELKLRLVYRTVSSPRFAKTDRWA
jgi:iron-sulfur cluster repair protein YtfE (RIC family)